MTMSDRTPYLIAGIVAIALIGTLALVNRASLQRDYAAAMGIGAEPQFIEPLVVEVIPVVPLETETEIEEPVKSRFVPVCESLDDWPRCRFDWSSDRMWRMLLGAKPPEPTQ